MDLGEKLGPLPRWVWALGAGGLIGLLWVWRSRSSSTPAPVATSADASADTEGDPDPTTIVPYPSGGIGDDQFQQLLAAIRGLYGPGSAPPPSSTGNVRGGGPWIGTPPPQLAALQTRLPGGSPYGKTAR